MGFNAIGYELKILVYGLRKRSHFLPLLCCFMGLPWTFGGQPRLLEANPDLTEVFAVSSLCEQRGKDEISRTAPFWTRLYRNLAQYLLIFDTV